MAISDAQYDAWLKADNKRRTLLVEAKAYSGGAEVTRYFATTAFVSTPTDTPANTSYDDIIREVPYFSARIPEVFGGRSEAGWGDIVIINESGVRDAWLNDAWDGRALKMYLGDPTWPKSDFRVILTGVSADLVAHDRNRLALRIRDKSWALNVPLQKTLVGGTTAYKDKPKPVCYGEVFNVEPPLIDAGLHKYQVHDGAVNAISDVRESGLTVAGYTADIATGTFTIPAAAAGRITADVQGAKPGGTYLTKAADIIKDIVTTRTALTAADVDTTNFTAFNTTAPQKIGFFAQDFQSVAAALDEIITSVGGFWCFDRTGLLTLGQFVAPSGTEALALVSDDVSQKGLRIVDRIPPVKTYRLGYKRNHTLQADGLAGAVTEANRAEYRVEYRVKSAINAGVETTYLLAASPDEVGTLLADATEAQTECTRRATLWGSLRFRYEARAFAAPFTVRLGQVVKLTHPRFGFSAGKLATVVGTRWYPTRKRVVMELFA